MKRGKRFNCILALNIGSVDKSRNDSRWKLWVTLLALMISEKLASSKKEKWRNIESLPTLKLEIGSIVPLPTIIVVVETKEDCN